MATVTLAFYKGRGTWTDWVIRAVTRGAYSHVELIDGEAVLGWEYACLSSSGRDGGVRVKQIELDPAHWDLVRLQSNGTQQPAQFIRERLGLRYDWLGIVLSQMLPLARHGKRRWFCSELVGAALGLTDAHRLSPQLLFDVVTFSRGGA